MTKSLVDGAVLAKIMMEINIQEIACLFVSKTPQNGHEIGDHQAVAVAFSSLIAAADTVPSAEASLWASMAFAWAMRLA